MKQLLIAIMLLTIGGDARAQSFLNLTWLDILHYGVPPQQYALVLPQPAPAPMAPAPASVMPAPSAPHRQNGGTVPQRDCDGAFPMPEWFCQ
jgi:hypothetical protein